MSQIWFADLFSTFNELFRCTAQSYQITQPCSIALLSYFCAMRCFIRKWELTWACGDIWATCSPLLLFIICLSPCQIVIFKKMCVYRHGCCSWLWLYVVVVGRITFDRDDILNFFCGNLYPAMHIPADSTLLASSTCCCSNRWILAFPFHWCFSHHFLFSCYPALLWSHPCLYPVY